MSGKLCWTAGLKYKTRDGFTAHIYMVHQGGAYPIHGWIEGAQGDSPVAWNKNGRWSASGETLKHPYDLTIAECQALSA